MFFTRVMLGILSFTSLLVLKFISTVYCLSILSITSSTIPSTIVLFFRIFSSSSVDKAFFSSPPKLGIALISPDSAVILPNRWFSVNTISPVRTASISSPYLTFTLLREVFSSNFPSSSLLVLIKSSGITGTSRFPSTVNVPPL